MMISEVLSQRLRQAEHIVVFTGAGMSAESGIPTFRDRFQGLWARYDPAEVATASGFRANPQFVWDWHVYLAEAMRKASPNAGHHAVAKLAGAVKKLTVITQNIDGFHQAAGSQNVLELHGNLFRLKPFEDEEAAFADGKNPIICHVCDGYADPELVNEYASRIDLEGIELVAGPVPKCPSCGNLLRPDIVWFGEMLDVVVLDNAISAVQSCDALICIGSSLEVQPAASLPFLALENRAVVIEINPQSTELTAAADASLVGGAAEILPKLLAEVWGLLPDKF